MMMMMLTVMLMVTMKQMTVKGLIDEDENPNLNQNDDEEEEYEEEYVRTPDNYEFCNDDEENEELYKDVKVRLKYVKHEEEVKGDAEMTDAGRDNVSQENSSISSDFSNQILNLDNALLVDNEAVSMMNVKVHHEEPSTQTPSFLNIPVTSQIPVIIDAQLSTRLEDSTQKAFWSYINAEFKKKAQGEKKRYIDLIEKSVKDTIKDEVNSQLHRFYQRNFFIISSITVQTSGSGISNLLAVGTTFTGSGNLYCQWELSPGSGNALVYSWSSGSGSYIILSSTHNSISLSLDAGLMLSFFFFTSIAVQTSGSGISNLLAVATTFTGSGNLYCQWEHLTWLWECLVHFIPNNPSLNLMLLLHS
nr:hypothetical protein [Tanacetum cinerariifolium]